MTKKYFHRKKGVVHCKDEKPSADYRKSKSSSKASTSGSFDMFADPLFVERARKGRTIWEKRYGNEDGPFLEGSALVYIEEGYVVAGKSAEYAGVPYFMKVDYDGEIIWTETYLEEEYIGCIKIVAEGDYLVALSDRVSKYNDGYSLLRMTGSGEVINGLICSGKSKKPVI